MNIFDYLALRQQEKIKAKERKENMQAVKDFKKLEIEIAELSGTLIGLEEKFKIYKEANVRLQFSNHEEQGEIAVDIAKKRARLNVLQKIKARMENTEVILNYFEGISE